MFIGGLTSDPLTQNSCHTGWGNIIDSGVTVICAGMVGGGVSNGGTVSGTGRWKYDSKTESEADGITQIHFTINEDHWDAPSGDYVKKIIIQHYPTDVAVKAALLDGSLDAVIGGGVLTEADVADLKSNHINTLTVSLTDAIQNRIIVFNTAKHPTDELQTRKVIIHAIDKSVIIQRKQAGLADTAESLFPKDAPYCGADFTPVPDYDFEKARLLNCPEPEIQIQTQTIEVEKTTRKEFSTGAIVGIAVLAVFVALICTTLCVMYRRERVGDPLFQPLTPKTMHKSDESSV